MLVCGRAWDKQNENMGYRLVVRRIERNGRSKTRITDQYSLQAAHAGVGDGHAFSDRGRSGQFATRKRCDHEIVRKSVFPLQVSADRIE